MPMSLKYVQSYLATKQGLKVRNFLSEIISYLRPSSVAE